MAEIPKIVVTNPVFPETRALLEETQLLWSIRRLSRGPMRKCDSDAGTPTDCLRS